MDAEDPSPLKQIRTYQGDMAEAIKDEHQSLVSIRAAEKARQTLLATHASESAASRGPANHAAARRHLVSIAFFIGGLVLLGAAGYGGYSAYTAYLHKTAVPAPYVPGNRFLAVSHTQDADASILSRDALIALLASARGTSLSAGAMEQVELYKGPSSAETLTTPSEFLLLAGARPSPKLVRALDPLFMIGALGLPASAQQTLPVLASTTPATASSTQASASTTLPELAPEKTATFILFKLDSYDTAYAGMLDWEKDMASDLLPLFHSADTNATVPANATWTDETIKNKDARKLADAGGKTVLIYSFYNQNLLIITANEAALQSILTALDTQALTR